MRNLKLTVTYDGTDFNGFQAQTGANLRTVQECLESVWHKLTGESIRLVGAGRTDAGVHAQGQVVNFRTERGAIPVERVPYAMNSLLPDDVRIVGCERVRDDFHARFDARSKVYEYRICNRPFPNPLVRRYSLFEPRRLDVDAMASAATLLIGRHDFAAMAGQNGTVRSSVRTVMACDVRREGDSIRIVVQADGFLYHMVRTIVGTLLVVGRGEAPPGWVGEVLRFKERNRAGATAPAHGLTLVAVHY